MKTTPMLNTASLIAIAFGTLLISITPATFARSDSTIVVTCSGGFSHTMDAQATGGQTTAVNEYNTHGPQAGPFAGETCALSL